MPEITVSMAFGRTDEEIKRDLLAIWEVMRECVKRGCSQEGLLPGGLKVRRRANSLHRSSWAKPPATPCRPWTG